MAATDLRRKQETQQLKRKTFRYMNRGETCKLRNRSPATLAITEDEVDEFHILVRSPRAFLQSNFVAARLPSHLSRDHEHHKVEN